MSKQVVAGRGTGGAVSTPHHAATDAARRVFVAGGNAVDAALAAAAMLTVVYPNQCSLGGDLIALVGTPDGTIHSVNASGRAPQELDLEAVRSAHPSMPVTGPLAVTVPGVVSGWGTMSSRWGTEPLSSVLAEAHEAARDGVRVTAGVARGVLREQAKIDADQGLRELFHPGGQPLAAGQTLRQPRLADALSMLRADGPSALYNGQLGQMLVDELRGRGSAMGMDDFRDHRVQVGAAACAQFDGLDYVSTAGNSQGLFFLAGVGALEAIRAGGADVRATGAAAGTVATVLARAALERDVLLGDDGHDDELRERILCPEHLREMCSANGVAPGVPLPAASGDTVGVVTADSSGMWVSLLQSVFQGFGAGILEPRSGIVLQNRGAAFTLDDGAPNTLGPGRRPPHTLMPVLVRRGETIVAARAVMGGRAQPAIQTHLMLEAAHGAGAQDAVSSPRWVLRPPEIGAASGEQPVRSILLEEGCSPQTVDSLQASGFGVQRARRYDDEFGHAHVVESASEAPRGFAAGSDPRADGGVPVGEIW